MIYAIIRIKQRVRSKQHVDRCVGQSVGRESFDWRPTVGRLSISYHRRFIWAKFFLSLSWEINLSQMQFYFALIKNSIFFLFLVTHHTAFGHFTLSDASDDLLRSVIAIQKLMFNRPWLGGRCWDEIFLVVTKDNLQKSRHDSRMMATTNITGNGTQTKTFEGLVSVDVFQSISFSAVNILLSITATLGNSLILVALHKESSLHPPSKLCYRCLATTDFLVGLVTQPLYATYWISVVHEHWSLFWYARDAVFISSHALCSVSLLTLTAISVDRLLALLLGLRYKKDCNFEAYIFYFSYRLGFMSSRWYMLLSQLPYSHSVQLCRYILLPSYIGRLVHKDFSRSHSSSAEPTKCTKHGAIQKGTTQCSVGAVRFNCLLFTIFYIDHSLWSAMSEWHQNWGNSKCLTFP